MCIVLVKICVRNIRILRVINEKYIANFDRVKQILHFVILIGTYYILNTILFVIESMREHRNMTLVYVCMYKLHNLSYITILFQISIDIKSK